MGEEPSVQVDARPVATLLARVWLLISLRQAKSYADSLKV